MGKRMRAFAPAKINLYLHVVGKRADGYHLLDSLVAFADVGDFVDVEEASAFSFTVSGAFSAGFDPDDLAASPSSRNLVVRAARALAEAAGQALDVRLALEKDLPLASGIGGGSADAAAVIRALQNVWELDPGAAYLSDMLALLGADVPVCYAAAPRRISGVGDVLELAPAFPDFPVVLVNPLKACPTAQVFDRHHGFSAQAPEYPKRFADAASFLMFLRAQHNALLPAALEIVPEISDCLEILEKQAGCLFSRLSGSGATCFALFETQDQAWHAAQRICAAKPDWWVRAGRIDGGGG